MEENQIESTSPDEKKYSIIQYNMAIERYLLQKVPRVWVHGVITQLNVRGRVVYLKLGQFIEGDHQPHATLDVTMWKDQYEAYNKRFAELPLPFQLRTEIKVCVFLEVAFFARLGKFQPKIMAVDENFTLGELTQTRQKILETLKKEGLLDKNKSLNLSKVPLKVGLISAPESAAYNDFVKTLSQSPFSFQVYFHPAKMQGEFTESTVVAALQNLQSYPLDVICLVRGGGAKMDLVYFDSEKICRSIAQSKIPILTGIGHEIDESLADRVAWINKITPTDCAKFLVDRLDQAYQLLLDQLQFVQSVWKNSLFNARRSIYTSSMQLHQNWRSSKEKQFQALGFTTKILKQNTDVYLRKKTTHLRSKVKGIDIGIQKKIQYHRYQLSQEQQIFLGWWKNFYFTGSKELHRIFRDLNHRWQRKIHLESEFQSRALTGLRLGPPKFLDFQKEVLETLESKFQLVSPHELHRRGWAYLKNHEANLLTSVKQVSLHEEFMVFLADGNIKAKVIERVVKDG